MCSLKTCFTLSSIFTHGTQTPSFHQECSGFWISANCVSVLRTHRVVPIDPFSATLLSPHICTLVPSSQRERSVKRNQHVRFFFLFGLTCSSCLGLCMTECFTVIKAKVTKSLLSTAFWHLCLFFSVQSSARAHSDASFPKRTLDCANSMFASISCGCVGTCNTAFGLLVTYPPHSTQRERERVFTAGLPGKRLSSVQCQTIICATNCGEADKSDPVGKTLNIDKPPARGKTVLKCLP